MHTHVLGPKRRGPSGDPHLKCVICGKSQRTNLKNDTVIKCEQTDNPGGLCCKDCFGKIPDNTPRNCEEWLKATLINSLCEICGKRTEAIMTCMLCEKHACDFCLAPESFETYGFSSGFPLCTRCLPQRAKSSENGEISRYHNGVEHRWCLFCQEFHPVIDKKPMCPLDDSSTPKLIEILEEDPDHFYHSTPLTKKKDRKTKSEDTPGQNFIKEGSSEIAAAIITMTKAIADNSAQITQLISLQSQANNNPATLNTPYTKAARGEFLVRDSSTVFDENTAAEAEQLHVPQRVAEQKMTEQIYELKELVLSLKKQQNRQNSNVQNQTNSNSNNSRAFHARRRNQNKNKKKAQNRDQTE